MTLLIIILIIYILSVLKVRNWVKKAYSKGGRWDLITPDSTDMVITYLPFYNTCWGIATFFITPYESGGNRFKQKKRRKKKFNYNRHFNIKKSK